jgi:5-methylcytosine-specific restriction enzyme A
VHHVIDIASVGAEYVVEPIRDLRPVFPNCHAMLHTDRPALDVDMLRKMISRRRESS